MKFTNIEDVTAFLEAVKKCKGGVTLRSQYGDCFNLKSALSQYVAIGALLGNHGEDLELFCDSKDDEKFFMHFFNERPGVL